MKQSIVAHNFHTNMGYWISKVLQGLQPLNAVNPAKLLKSNNPYLCGNCVQKSSVQSKLELFKIIHSVQRSYSCKFCTLTFSDKYQAEGHEIIHDIRNHKIKSDKSQMIHVCKICHKDYIGPDYERVPLKLLYQVGGSASR